MFPSIPRKSSVSLIPSFVAILLCREMFQLTVSNDLQYFLTRVWTDSGPYLRRFEDEQFVRLNCVSVFLGVKSRQS